MKNDHITVIFCFCKLKINKEDKILTDYWLCIYVFRFTYNETELDKRGAPLAINRRGFVSQTATVQWKK